MFKLKAILLTVTCASLATAANAQLKVNPQIGGNFTNLTNTPSEVSTSAAFGFQLGTDFRMFGGGK